jgi:hypothetical protein
VNGGLIARRVPARRHGWVTGDTFLCPRGHWLRRAGVVFTDGVLQCNALTGGETCPALFYLVATSDPRGVAPVMHYLAEVTWDEVQRIRTAGAPLTPPQILELLGATWPGVAA